MSVHAIESKLCGKFHEQEPQEMNLLEWMNHTALDITGLSFRISNTTDVPAIPPFNFRWQNYNLEDRFNPNCDSRPSTLNEILQQFRDVVQETARQTIKNVARDKYSKDIVALWASAGLDENLMDEDEILSQLVTATLGGEDTVVVIVLDSLRTKQTT
ncbi:hypothetical protein EDD18DRAFT_1361138 [Armillaria luteobubalina]|uniref:Uncharacterized protein n=1 Tax=Armillaria luteobubalina TaxID=153913 RepID=A0AA39PJI7_9AGAR|nr:hypothetical protein EDD18DRAFT_1361138 [Armillaria luteobubalina]